MSATIIDGRAVAKAFKEEIALRTQELIQKGVTPHLAVVLVGENPASQVYVRNKENGCIKAGIRSTVIRMDEGCTQQELEETVIRLNEDESVHGILVQLPLPKGFDTDKIIAAIAPEKDVDGISQMSAGALALGRQGFVPCTPRGVMRMLAEMGVEIRGKKAVVIGRSNIVGKPVAQLLLAADATVTICHSRTENLPEVVRQADIVVAAVGRAKMVKADWLKPGAVVIDVGINRGEGKKVYGDVDFEPAAEVASMITPVPGGVGPMTIAMLLENTLDAAARCHG